MRGLELAYKKCSYAALLNDYLSGKQLQSLEKRNQSKNFNFLD
jgi:hypothetical protein